MPVRPRRVIAGVIIALLTIALGLTALIRPLFLFHRSGDELIRNAEQILHRAGTFNQIEALRALGENPLNGFYLRLDDALDEAVPAPRPETPVTTRDFAAALIGYEFDDPAFVGLVPVSGGYQIKDGALSLTWVKGEFLHTPGEIQVDARTVAEIEIKLKLRDGHRFQLAWSQSAHPAYWARDDSPADRPVIDRNKLRARVEVDAIQDGRFHIYRLNAETLFKRTASPDHTLGKLFLIPSDVDGDDVVIDYVRFVSKKARYARSPYGVTHETRNGEMRKVLYLGAPGVLRYTIEIPPGPAWFEFGLSSLDSGNPISCSVQVVTENGEERLFTESIARSDRWEDYRIDLSSWTGQKLELKLEATGAAGNIAFWSNPIIAGHPRQRLNIIVVVEDSLRADHLALYGHDRPTSPARDAWAAEGVVFRHAIAQATQTRPSVASLMTSLYPTATGVWRQTEMLSDSYLTLAEILRSQGFATAAFIQNFNAGPHAGLHQGFSRLVNAEALGYTPDGLYSERLFDLLEQSKDRNFFLYLHLWDPHFQYDPPEALRAWHTDVQSGTPVEPSSRYDPHWVENPTIEGRRALYDGEVLNNDRMFATLLERLDRSGLRDDTLLILTSDHGEFLGERGEWGHQPPGFHEVLHVPLIMVHPRRFPRQHEVAETVELIDLMPTLLALAGIERFPLLLYGESLLPLILQNSGTPWRGGLSLSEEVVRKMKSNRKPWASLFHDDLHILNSDTISDGPLILSYSGADDAPNETARVAFESLWRRSFNRTIRRIQELNLETWKLFSRKDSLNEEVIPVDPEQVRKLEALGYL